VGIRQTINENPAITAAATGAIILAAIIFIIVEALPHHPKAGPPGKLFYTDDDGKTWFPDDAMKVPPYTDTNGKDAVLAYVYKCGENGQSFVGYMLKYTPDGVQRMQKQMSAPNTRMMDIPPVAFSDTMVKKPGDPDSAWVTRVQDPVAYQKATTPTCPDGGTQIYPVNANVAN
jgi:hypothetical protein